MECMEVDILANQVKVFQEIQSLQIEVWVEKAVQVESQLQMEKRGRLIPSLQLWKEQKKFLMSNCSLSSSNSELPTWNQVTM